MAEERDQAERTEEPTPRRLEQARERGQVAFSREVSHVLLLGCGLSLAISAGPWSAEHTARTLQRLLAAAGVGFDLGEAGREELRIALGQVAAITLLWLVALWLAGLASPLLQRSVVWTPKPLAPKLERISPLAGIRRLISLATLVELAKGLVKLAIVGAVTGLVLRSVPAELPGLVEIGPVGLGERLLALSLQLVGAVLGAMLLLAAIDLFWQRVHHRRQLRMTRREIKEELRETEGDSVVKQRLRQLRLQRARHRMMAEVPKATVVITNPTHYAVALRYDPVKMAAPVLVAKGVDELAITIREVARRHGVPVVENPPLARALYAALSPGQTIPPAYYQAVAGIIAYVYRLAGRRTEGVAAPRSDAAR